MVFAHSTLPQTTGHAAPAAAVIAAQCRPLFDLGTSQVDPLEAAEPESGLRSVRSSDRFMF